MKRKIIIVLSILLFIFETMAEETQNKLDDSVDYDSYYTSKLEEAIINNLHEIEELYKSNSPKAFLKTYNFIVDNNIENLDTFQFIREKLLKLMSEYQMSFYDNIKIMLYPAGDNYFVEAYSSIAPVIGLTNFDIETFGTNTNAIDSFQSSLFMSKELYGHAPAYYYYAMTKVEQGDISCAISNLKKAVEKVPEFEEGWLGLGILYQKQAKYTNAIYAYNKLLNINTLNDRLVYNNIAEIYLARDEVEKAYYYGSMAVAPYSKREVPANPIFFDTMARVMLKMNKPKLAKRYYRNAINGIDYKLDRINTYLESEVISESEKRVYRKKQRELNDEKLHYKKLISSI